VQRGDAALWEWSLKIHEKSLGSERGVRSFETLLLISMSDLEKEEATRHKVAT